MIIGTYDDTSAQTDFVRLFYKTRACGPRSLDAGRVRANRKLRRQRSSAEGRFRIDDPPGIQLWNLLRALPDLGANKHYESPSCSHRHVSGMGMSRKLRFSCGMALLGWLRCYRQIGNTAQKSIDEAAKGSKSSSEPTSSGTCGAALEELLKLVQSAGMSDLLPSGRMSTNSKPAGMCAWRRTSRDCPWNG
jgi:hypothetical protein